MAKNFIPRVAKKDRKTLEVNGSTNLDLFRLNDQRLLKGAQLADVDLSKITVRKQVRTKFDDSSLRELADNIRQNGLIQPLVLHRENDVFLLLCGERRYRAMQLIDMKRAPCFILEGKSADELMAIQFSENSAREELHYIDKAEGIYSYKAATDASERKIVEALGISKSDVHRALIIAQLPKNVKEAAKTYNIEKYLLLEFAEIGDKKVRDSAGKKICSGEIIKRTHLKRFLEEVGYKLEKRPRSSKVEKSLSDKGLRSLRGNEFLNEALN